MGVRSIPLAREARPTNTMVPLGFENLNASSMLVAFPTHSNTVSAPPETTGFPIMGFKSLASKASASFL